MDPQYPQFPWQFFVVVFIVAIPFLYWLVCLIAK
jgi:hypothetical protein